MAQLLAKAKEQSNIHDQAAAAIAANAERSALKVQCSPSQLIQQATLG